MIAPDDPRHGTNAGHNAGCRCDPCKAGKLRYDKRRKWEQHATGQRRVVPSYRVVRRIHALQALGYSARVVAEEAGLSTKTVYDISLERSTSTWRIHHDAIAAAYDRLSGTVPEGVYVVRNRRYAAGKGWPPPLAWNDIDDPDETPTGWAYTPASRAEQLAEFVEQGAGVSEVCRRLHLSRNSLQKWCGTHDLHATYRQLVVREQWGTDLDEQVAS